MRERTVYFADATLLLAGGGVGAVAFAGACLAAEARGCRFHAAAATSTGAIVAALVAAGCSGRELIKAMVAMTRDLAGLGLDAFAATGSGEPCSSEPIQHWVDARLRAKVGVCRPVTFADLPRPLAVMAVDLRRGNLKVWSRASDPTMPVGLAVRCACSDPFRFAPVELDGQLLADASLLGDVSFSGIEDGAFQHCADLPALLLRLQPPELRDLGQGGAETLLMRRAGDIAMSRRAGAPSHPRAPCQEIAIPSASLRVDDASSKPEVRRALRAGHDAVIGFMDSERSCVLESGYLTRRLDLGHQPHLVDQTMIAMRSARRNIFIAGGDLSWAWELFPLLALEAKEGIPIRILAGKSIDPALSTILGQLGCACRHFAGSLLTYGAFIDADEPDGTAVLVKLRDGRLRGGALMEDRSVPGVLAALMERLELLWQAAIPQNTAAQPEFETIAWGSVEQALRKHVAPYRDAAFSPSALEVKDLLPLASSLQVARLRRAEAIADLYQRCGEPLFVPMRLRGGAWFLPPPVIEAVDGRLLVVDGEHRIHHCRGRGVTTIEAMVVHNAGAPLPASIGTWDSLLPLPCDVAREQRYQDYEASRWRDLRSAWTALAHQSLPDRPSAQAVR